MVPFWLQTIKQEYHLLVLGPFERWIYTPVLSFLGSTENVLARVLTDIGVMEVVLQ